MFFQLASHLIYLIFLLAFFIPAFPCHAQIYQPGFKTIGIWIEEPPLRLDIAVWYPAMRQPKEISMPPWSFSASLNAKIAEGTFPLLLLSHATPAERFSYHELASFLAREGFIVAVPTHNHDCMYNMDNLFTWTQLENRARELEATLDNLLKVDILNTSIAKNRIGLIGFGSGGTAALLLGGALPNCSNWDSYQNTVNNQDPYRTPWATDRLNTLCTHLPLKKSLADPRIKAIAVIAPGFGMLFDKSSFTYLYPPLLLVCAGKDVFNRSSLHCGPLARYLGNKAKFINLPQADIGSLLSSCPENLETELPELCMSVSKEQRFLIHQKLDNGLLAFFRHYLTITTNLPRIPAPPNLLQQDSPKCKNEKDIKK